LEHEYAGTVTVVNPFGAVVSQNKLTLALMWEASSIFTPGAGLDQALYSRRLSSRPAGLNTLLAQRQQWVLKSAYGCEGDETICGPYVSAAEWRAALHYAVPQYWVAQRFFQAAVAGDGRVPNYGVYLIGGRSAGFFTRLSTTATDVYAMTAPTFIAKG
jgi:uncharacterized circularly permuted ATP-grasp superfamily protein